jgi:predicted GNAT family N-acyltransferase
VRAAVAVGDTYMEDGIAHIEMRLPKETPQ